MKAAGAPQKLRFTVHACSGEDADYPVRELLFHSPQTRGWQSPRFCNYPQEILLRLEGPSKVHQLQILSHEYKIATRVDVYVGLPQGNDVDPAKCAFKRLGYLSFDSNQRSNHQARELKSVHVNVPAFYIRLLIHRCHVNKLNIYNQVGIIALNLIGEPLAPAPDGPPGFLQLHPPITREVPYYNAAAAEIADLNLDLHVDTVTAAKIRELVRQKDQAVAAEDYDTAKVLKAGIERLKVVGQKIAQLEARKRAAVEKEDYDTAKLIKVDIDKLRAAGEGAAVSGAVPAGAGAGGAKNPDDIFNRVLGNSNRGGGASSVHASSSAIPFDEQPVRPASSHAKPPRFSNAGSASGGGGGGDGGLNSPGSRATLEVDANLDDAYAPGPTSLGGAGGGKHQQYDERPAVGRGRYTPNMDGEGAPPPDRAIPPPQVDDSLPPPSGWPGDLPAPEPIPGSIAKDAEGLEEVAGEYVARSFFSKNWQLRDAAVQWLAREAREGQLGDKAGSFRTYIRTVQRAMKDKVANVYLSALSLHSALLDALGPSVGGREIEHSAETVLPLLIENLGNTNTRLREASRETIMFLAGLREAGLRSATGHFLKPVKSQTAWRPVLGVLQILLDLLPVIGMSKGGGEGFDLQELMEWVGKAYNSPNADVRSEAVKVTKEVADMVGPAIRRCMPKDIPAKIKEQIDTALGGEGVPLPPPPPSTSKPAPPPPRAAAPPPARGPSAKSVGGAKSGGGGKAAAAPPPPPPPPPPASDDPSAFEAELKARERSLGPDHPDVAESASNLAILYSQKGRGDKALPLYERALKIYEKHYGPDHPEVAHTLTDLAVLHLEQGRDKVGRPLLERALAIQEAALGPEHPDVLAIRDVLNSE